MRTRILVFGAFFSLAGCSMSTKDENATTAPTNQCKNDGDCASAGGRCVNHMCVAAQGVISSLVFKIDAPGTSSLSQFAGKTLLTSQSSLPLGGGELDLTVPGLSQVNGTITLPPSRIAKVAACTFDFTTSPLTVTLSPRVSWPGPSVSPTTTTATAPRCTCDSGTCTACAPKFSITVPAGDYDLYLEQKLADPSLIDPACQIVPGAFPLTLQEGSAEVALALPEPKTLNLGVSWPAGNDASVLAHWMVDMLDPLTGRRLSTQVVLAAIDPSVSPPVYVATLDYLEDSAHDGNETVRLGPPSDVAAPTVLVARPALELFQGRSVLQVSALPSPVDIQGSLLDGRPNSKAQGVPGTVKFVATSLDGIPSGTTASFERSGQFDDAASGLFHVTLLPGQYHVYGMPADHCPSAPCPNGAATCDCPLGATDLSWVVVGSPSVQGGKSVALSARTNVVGYAYTPLGSAANGSAARLEPQPVSITPLETALGEAPITPRTSVGSVDRNGYFLLPADSAAHQLTLRPASSSGFPWYVRPALIVDGSLAGSEQNLENLSLPLPVRYSGHVTVAGKTTVLPDVVIRAYAFVGKNGLTSGPDDPSDPALSVIQVAETTADSSGKFDLLLPARVESGPP
jgi:hypothetical protein